MTRCVPIALLLLVVGCNRVAANIDFERMIDQAKYEAYEADAMRAPPAGTVPRERVLDDPARDADGAHVETIPVRVDALLLARGRDRFERFCAACHGVLGTGNPPVVENMALRPPPSLHTREIAEEPPGELFDTITRGYGLMPSYRAELEPRDRWAVIAYLRALWLSQRAELAALPPGWQREAKEHLP